MSVNDPLPEITTRALRVLGVTAAAWGLPAPESQDGRLPRWPGPAPALRRRRAHAQLSRRLWPARPTTEGWPLSGLAW